MTGARLHQYYGELLTRNTFTTNSGLIARFMWLEILQQARQQVSNNAKSETTADRGKLWTASQSEAIIT